jgi:phosphatidylserine/phosphatidylglycerophosphate/cardiolipin synthase-like enzyme/uncharacterized membrane protein YdjX (TVP38/TMEM64 family)
MHASFHVLPDQSTRMNFPHSIPSPTSLPTSPISPNAAADAAPNGFFVPGENCWRVEHADRFRMLIDGEEYFTALRQAIVNAQQTVFILGWDIDSKMRLMPGGANDGFPEPLAEFLHAVVASRRNLRIYVLSWDFAMLYAFEREWLPVFKMGWRAHRRFIFKQDGRHPLGGSHHQKIVLIDDRLAFVGGLDLTRSRWDTREHLADQPLRRDANGQPYPPFHDVQVMFDGAAAGAIGELVRERWLRANGRRVAVSTREMRTSGHDPWPGAWVPDIENVDLAICRTEPEYGGRPAVQEIRQMYVDAVRRARHHIFCENQYFTSGIIGQALLERLSQKDGPEVAILSRRVEGGWLQEATMGVLRARLHRDLKSTEGTDRYRMYCPHVPGLGSDCVNVHSKVMVVDGDLLFVGSANLNNRSMVLDTECNVALDGAVDSRVRDAIAAMRNRLLAEHLGESEVVIADTLRETDSLIATIERLRGAQARTLEPHEPAVTPDMDALVPGEAVIDPETPIAPERLVTQFVPETRRRPLSGRFALLGVVALLIAACAGLWHWTPLGQYLSLSALTRLTEQLSALPFSPVIILGAYVVGGLVSLPITLMIAATGIAFGAFEGGAYALTGTMMSAAVTYLIGRWLGRDTVRRLAGSRINGLSERLAERGLVAMVILRLLPVAPFTVVNVIAGASQIGFRDYLIGTFIGMGPGIIVTVAFAHQLVSAVRHPTWGAFLILAAIGIALVGISVLLQRFFRARAQSSKPKVPSKVAPEGMRGTMGGADARAAREAAQTPLQAPQVPLQTPSSERPGPPYIRS